jgi:N4-gp56 family major capsid protein
MALTTSATLPGPVAAYYEKRWLLRAAENFVYEGLGMPGRVPKGEGKTVVWNRMTNPSAKTTALTEGTDPTPSGLSATLVSATLAEYGNFEQVTSFLEMTAIDTTVKEVIDTLAYEAAKSIDTKIATTLITGGTALIVTAAYANSAGFTPTRNSINDNDTFTVADVRRANRQLQRFGAQTHTKDRYVATAHPDVIFDLQGDSNWTNAHIYTEKGIDAIYNGEAGEIYGTRFVMSQQAPVLTNSGSAGTEVYLTHVMGKDFFGVSKIQNLTTYVDSPSPRSALRMYSDIGWKAGFAIAVLNDSFGIRVESAATIA